MGNILISFKVSTLKKEILEKLREKEEKESIAHFLARLPGRVIFRLLSRELQEDRTWPSDG